VAADRYLALRASACSQGSPGPRRSRTRGEAAAAALERALPQDEALCDVDAMVTRYCGKHGLARPADVEQKDRCCTFSPSTRSFVNGSQVPDSHGHHCIDPQRVAMSPISRQAGTLAQRARKLTTP
jgi:hypothetical protein